MDLHLLTWIYLASLALGLLMWPLILLSNKQPASLLAWMMGVALVPVGGPLLFILVGRDRILRGLPRRKRRAKKRYGLYLSRQGENPPAGEGTLHLVERPMLDLLRLQSQVGHHHLSTGNRLELLGNAETKYERLFQDIQAARHHINLEYYILRDDQTGGRLAGLLAQKAAQGVAVRVLLDSIGSFNLSKAFINRLSGAGIRLGWFHRVNPFIRINTWNLRNHRKIAVIDGRVGYVGGINLGDDYLGRGGSFSVWEDVAVRIEGPGAHSLQRIFAEDWAFAAKEWLGGEYFPPFEPQHTPDGEFVQVMASGPDEDQEVISKVYFGAITLSRQRAWLMTPYFLPDETFQAALCSAALRGVDVRVITNRRSDNKLVDLASRSFFPPLLEAGVRIYLFRPGMMHAKTLMVDGQWSAISTANLDVRSLRLNFEAGAMIYSPRVAQELEAFCEAQMGRSDLARLSALLERPTARRMAESLTRLLSPLL